MTLLKASNLALKSSSEITVSVDLLTELRQFLFDIQTETNEIAQGLNDQKKEKLLLIQNKTTDLLAKIDRVSYSTAIEEQTEQRYFISCTDSQIIILCKQDFKDISHDSPLLQKVVDVVLSQIESQNLRPNEICKHLGVSRSQLYRKMKEQTDISVARFIRLIRLRVAKQYLCSTSMRISEVAYKVGFNSASYFSRAFIQEFGMSPRMAREQQLGL